MMATLAMLVHAALMAVAAPVLAGLLGVGVALVRQQPPPPPMQPWRDLVRLFRKTGARPSEATVLFTLAPPVSLAAAGLAALLTPSFALGMAGAGAADLVLVASLLAVSAVAAALGGAEAGALQVHAALGTLRGGVVAAPVMLLVAYGAALLVGGSSLDAAAAAVRDGGVVAHVAGACLGVALLAVCAGVPTAMVHGGRALALLQLAGQLRLVVAVSAAACLALPMGLAAASAPGFGWLLGVMAWAMKALLLASLTLTWGRWPALAPAAALLALIGLAFASVQGAA